MKPLREIENSYYYTHRKGGHNEIITTIEEAEEGLTLVLDLYDHQQCVKTIKINLDNLLEPVSEELDD